MDKEQSEDEEVVHFVSVMFGVCVRVCVCAATFNGINKCTESESNLFALPKCQERFVFPFQSMLPGVCLSACVGSTRGDVGK